MPFVHQEEILDAGMRGRVSSGNQLHIDFGGQVGLPVAGGFGESDNTEEQDGDSRGDCPGLNSAGLHAETGNHVRQREMLVELVPPKPKKSKGKRAAEPVSPIDEPETDS